MPVAMALDAAGANAERVHRDAEIGRQLAAAIDARPFRVAVVLDCELTLFGLQLVQTPIETLEALLAHLRVFAVGARNGCHARFGAHSLHRQVPRPPPKILEQDEPSDDVAVAGGRSYGDGARLAQRFCDAIERLVRELVRKGPIPSIEIRDKAAADLQIRFAPGVDAVIEPFE